MKSPDDVEVIPPEEPTKLAPGEWRKGMRSPNPSGMPRGYSEFRAACRDKTQAALDTLVRLLERNDATAAFSARVLLEYGWGKPQSAPEDLEAGQAQGQKLASLSRAELLAIASLPTGPGPDGKG